MTTDEIHIEVTEVNRPFWDGTEHHELRYQACPSCGHRWLPARTECPRCLATTATWEPSDGTGTLVSWVTYRRAYHPAFEKDLPYTVGIIELTEGPRLAARLLGDPASFTLDQPMTVEFHQRAGHTAPFFRAA